MSTYAFSPGLFKAKDADPESTLELFEDYLENMVRVFRLSRRIHPTTGAKVEFDDDEKKDMLIVEGGADMNDLFKHVGKVLNEDTYEQATEKIRRGLKGRGNRTSAVFKLFNSHPQGQQSFDSWHREVYKAAKLIDWTSGEGIPNHPRFDQWQPGKVGGQVVEDVSSSGALKEERSGRDTLSPRKRKRLQSAARFKKNV